MVSYKPYGLGLSVGQKTGIKRAYDSKTSVVLQLKHANLAGNDTLGLTQTQINRIEKAKKKGTGLRLTLSFNQLKANHKGGFITAIIAGIAAAVGIGTSIYTAVNNAKKTNSGDSNPPE